MSTIKTNAITTVAGKPILNSTGSILQVVQTTSTTASSTTSGSFVATSLSSTITPSSSSNKILVIITGGIQNNTANGGIYAALFKNGSILWTDGKLQQFSTGNNVSALSISYLDSPATTSSITYAYYHARYNTGTASVNYGAIQLLEVSG